MKVMLKLAAVALMTAGLAACASDPDAVDAAGGAGAGGGIGAGALDPRSVEYFQVEVGDRVFFGFDSSTLDARAIETLTRQARWLLENGSPAVTLEGHADERGTREYNLALGARRAQAARDFLVSQGLDGNRIRTVSYGKERPVALGSDEGSWAQNRRAVTVVAGMPTS